jgi:predicted RNase H-like nuclease (RuvC/YqgF family)
MTEQKAKIKELKNQIILAQDGLSGMIAATPTVDVNQNKEHQDQLIQDYKSKLVEKRAILSSLKEELNRTKMNKNLSKFFEFIPSAPNRHMRKLGRKLMKA